MHLQSAPGTELTTCPLALLRPDVVVECGAVAIVSSGGRLHAFEAQCPHGAASLGEGSVRRGVLTCPRHGARFRLSDGKALSGPVRRPLELHRADLERGEVVVRAGAPVRDRPLRVLTRRGRSLLAWLVCPGAAAALAAVWGVSVLGQPYPAPPPAQAAHPVRPDE